MDFRNIIYMILLVSIVQWTVTTLAISILEIIQRVETFEIERILWQQDCLMISRIINMQAVYLFLSRIKLAEIQLKANMSDQNVKIILKKVKKHIRMYNISYIVFIGYIASYFVVNQLYKDNQTSGLDAIKVINFIWIVLALFLTAPLSIYYYIMINRFMKLL